MWTWVTGSWSAISVWAPRPSLNQTIDSSTLSGFAADLGAGWRWQGTGLSLACAVQNIGGQVSGSDLPLNLKVGTAYRSAFTLKGDTEKNNFIVAADANLSPADSNADFYSLGAELWLRSLMALRGGYKLMNQGDVNGATGFTYGLGFRMSSAEINYALMPRANMGQSQQLSILFTF